ncbi:3-isopropylmalate dehydratase small subunit [Deinococcus peraridilitoris]|uniref:3-isopropylmalate dehydratase small subunit n=1 Tax=Deinococcus peraridilitoris (strain DSM 19664 / LMG 22246 / CIP 109416 / KR-200) TaxID=937777 RepID=L0A312_DEIPD|nr:3-isopropylmalate dehydratase small subunit [Deinococcus peraridilitoris]AFZ68226.1 3-isopropylmalate dehydratase, small subunit [Deinococcus peraridilitoris DSM 19664]
MPKVWKFGDGVNTDDILPGKYAPFMVGEDVFQTYAFHHFRPEFAPNVKRGDVLVGGRNWGLGSSREYAPMALRKLGIGGIIAASFARIHYRNLLNLGIPAFEAPDLIGQLGDGDEVTLDVNAGILRRGHDEFQLGAPPEFLREALREGSILEFYRKYQRFPGEEPT